MKILSIENRLIVSIYTLLNKLELRGKASRGRSKLMARLVEKEKEFLNAKADIQKDYFAINGQGEFVVDGDMFVYKEGITPKEKNELVERLDELQNEKFEISFAEYSDKYNALFDELENLDMLLTGEDAIAYDELMDAYDRNEEEK